jgi:hypothetical protein
MSGVNSDEWQSKIIWPEDEKSTVYHSIEDTAPVDGPYPAPKPKETIEEMQKRMWEAVKEFS